VKTAGDAILLQLKSRGEVQAETLARRLGISVQAVRQRLDRLLAESFVAYSDRAHGRGRPRRLWALAPGAASLFPDTHAQLTVDLIGTIRTELGETALTQLLERRREQITAAYRKRLARKRDVAKKLTALADMRLAEGYIAWLEALGDDGLLFVEDHCPICAAAITCQGFRSIELEVFRNLLVPDWHIDREDHLLSGGSAVPIGLPPADNESSRGRHDAPAAHLRAFEDTKNAFHARFRDHAARSCDATAFTSSRCGRPRRSGEPNSFISSNGRMSRPKQMPGRPSWKIANGRRSSAPISPIRRSCRRD
jgi:predicted ArsR family transcriptional regulator